MKKTTLQDLEFLLILLKDMPTGVTSDLNGNDFTGKEFLNTVESEAAEQRIHQFLEIKGERFTATALTLYYIGREISESSERYNQTYYDKTFKQRVKEYSSDRYVTEMFLGKRPSLLIKNITKGLEALNLYFSESDDSKPEIHF